MKKLSFVIVFLVVIFGGYYTIRAEAERKDTLTFSNTMEWSPYYLAYANSPTRYSDEVYKDIILPPPPKNSSRQVKEEMRTLKSYRELRSPEQLEEFEKEGEKETLEFGGYTFGDYNNEKLFPATARLLRDSFYDVEVLEMRQKKLFDRVRPSFLDPSFDTMRPVHGHPAYPSYRSAEMHFIAHVFSELAPERREEFFARAQEVAFRCQIAGLQYPSDTEGGKLLAKQIFDALMKNEKFRALIAEARKEWLAKGLAK